MEIAAIKDKLTLADVLNHYGLKPDKHMRLHCPFHPDKTPSLQVYYKTHTCYCFSTNCPTHGKSLDVIDFIMHKEGYTKHEAILKAKELITGNISPAQELTRTAILTKMFTYFKNAVHNSPPAREYIESRSLDFTKLEIGYNTGQFHHGSRKDEALIKSCVKIGLLSPFGTNSRSGGQAYKSFAKNCICFALRNRSGQVSGLYFRSTGNDKNQRHFYLKDRQGLYPKYPSAETKRLILTESIIDAGSLLQEETITKDYTILALYGTNGLTEEHKAAIKALDKLEEVIFFLNGDEPGKKAVKKHSQTIRELQPKAAISNIELPENEDVNSLLQGHSPEILHHFISHRQPLPTGQAGLSFSNETPSNEKENRATTPDPLPDQPVRPKQSEGGEAAQKLNTDNPHNIKYTGAAADYYIKGGLKGNLDSLKVSLQIVNRESRHDHRAKSDLYEYKRVESVSKQAAENLNLEQEAIKKDLAALTHKLEQYRSKSIKEQKGKYQRTEVKVPPATVNQCLDILQAKEPIKKIGELIGKAGVTGEENNRIFLLAIASSYKMPDTLHALIQGSSGSGKTRLLKIICELMPQEDTMKFTRVTDSSFYNYPEEFFVHKLLGFEDLDGLQENALLAVRELISNEILQSSTTIKTESGELTGAQKIVKGPVASISCTTKGAIYEDNMSRVFLIAVDESREQTKRIIQYQQKKAAGLIDGREEKKAGELLQNCVRLLKPYEVINPYAAQIQLPEEAHKIRRLNDLYLSFVKQITLLNQYKRKKDGQGRLITEIQDLKTANEIMFDSIVLKVDELDGSLRSFYEKLKGYVQEKGKDYEFSQREIRHAMRVSKTGCQNYIGSLLELEYIHQTYTGQRNTYHYKIAYWDSLEALREKIKKHLDDQLEKLITDQKQVVAKMVGQAAEQ